MKDPVGAYGREQRDEGLGREDIDVLLCTFRRPHLIETLDSIAGQILPLGVALRVIVADNDHEPSARQAVLAWAEGQDLVVTYLHAPAANISIARNAALDAATAGRVAFMDDDEIALPNWLAVLAATQDQTGADAVFGPSRAVYGPGTPKWMREQDHHSNVPERRGGEVCTGHTCNALLSWRGTAWEGQRFDLARGRSGGEDTEFFFRLARLGARFEIAEGAVVSERVAPERANFAWLRRRKFRMGQSYACSASGFVGRAGLFVSAAAKAGYCHLRAVGAGADCGTRAFWLLRGAMHAGVCAGCLAVEDLQIYGR